MLCFPFFPLLMLTPVERQQWDVGTTTARALELAQIERKEAATLMHVTEASLSRQLAGRYVDHITLDALSCLPGEFWIWFCCLVLEHYGLFPGTRELAARALTVTFRMAKAALRKDAAGGGNRVVA
jgi:hypothetical protein